VPRPLSCSYDTNSNALSCHILKFLPSCPRPAPAGPLLNLPTLITPPIAHHLTRAALCFSILLFTRIFKKAAPVKGYLAKLRTPSRWPDLRACGRRFLLFVRNQSEQSARKPGLMSVDTHHYSLLYRSVEACPALPCHTLLTVKTAALTRQIRRHSPINLPFQTTN
jgi:hypothetical protein